MKFTYAIRHVHVICLLALAGRQVQAGMSKSKMGKTGKSMYYKSPKMGMGKSYSKYEYYKPGPSHSGANVFEKMSYKSAMSMSYKGKGSYVYPYMSKGGYTSSKGKGGGYTSTKGKGGYSSSKGKGGYTSGKGKGGSIRMMSVKGKGKGKGKGGAIYVTQSPTDAPIVETTSPTSPLIITRSPTAPTRAPVTSPPVTSAPTQSPTVTFVQSEELCEPNEDGVYGTTEGTVEVVVFAYALETVPGTTDLEVEQIIDDLEGEIAASVIRRLAPQCAEEPTRRLAQQENQDEMINLLNQGEASSVSQRRLAQVLVGLSPKPDDRRLTDRECDKDVGENRCDLVQASLTIYYIDDGTRRLVQELSVEVVSTRRAQASIVDQVQGAIQTGMNNGDFNDNEGRSSDAVVSVEWVPLDDLDGGRDVDPIDNSEDDLEPLWIIVICLGGFLVCLICCAVYLCTRRTTSVDDDAGGQRDSKADRDIKTDQVSTALSGGGTSTNYGGSGPSSAYGGSSPYRAPNTNYDRNEESSEEGSDRQLGRFQQNTGSDSGRASV